MGKRKALLLILLPVVAACAIAALVSHWGPTKPSSWHGLAYDGMTVAEWEDEIQRWDPTVPAGFARRRPAWQEWLGKVGVQVGRTEPRLSLFTREDPQAVPVLIALMESTDPDVRWHATYTLVVARNPDAAAVVPALLPALDDSDQRVANLAGKALEILDETAARRAGVTWDGDGNLIRPNPDGTRRR